MLAHFRTDDVHIHPAIGGNGAPDRGFKGGGFLQGFRCALRVNLCCLALTGKPEQKGRARCGEQKTAARRPAARSPVLLCGNTFELTHWMPPPCAGRQLLF